MNHIIKSVKLYHPAAFGPQKSSESYFNKDNAKKPARFSAEAEGVLIQMVLSGQDYAVFVPWSNIASMDVDPVLDGQAEGKKKFSR